MDVVPAGARRERLPSMRRATATREAAACACRGTGLRGWRWLGAGLVLALYWLHTRVTPGAPDTIFRWLPCLAVVAAARFIWLNRGYRGLWLLSVGAALNLLVMAANGGLMPIAPHTAETLAAAVGQRDHAAMSLAHSKDRIVPDARARLPFLDDRLVFTVGNRHGAASLGDALVLLGCLLTLSEEVWRTKAAIGRPVRRGGR